MATDDWKKWFVLIRIPGKDNRLVVCDSEKEAKEVLMVETFGEISLGNIRYPKSANLVQGARVGMAPAPLFEQGIFTEEYEYRCTKKEWAFVRPSAQR